MVSAIYGLPNIILASKIKEDYKPLVVASGSPTARDEAFAYAPFVNFVNRGNLILKDTYSKEYASYSTPFTGETVPAIVFALISQLTGSIDQAFIVGDFIFPAIIFLLCYFLMKLFVKNSFYAASAAFIATVARDFIAVIPYPHETLQYLTVAENRNHFLYLSRAFHPQITLVFFMGAVISLIQLVKSPKSLKLQITLGLLTGILFYSYIFHWTYFVVVLGLTGIYLLLSKNFLAIRSLIISGFIALTIGSYYFYSIYNFYNLSFAQDFIDKSALHDLPLPITLARYMIIALLFAFLIKLKNYKSTIFFLVLLSGVMTPLISRFLIGQDLETFHYLRRALMPFATLALFIILYRYLKPQLLKRTFCILIIFYALFLGIKTQIVTSNNVASFHIVNRDQEAVFAWLKSNSPKNSVVGSLNTDFNSLIPIYTHNYVYFPPTDRTIMPTYEGVERFIVLSNLLGIETSVQKEILKKDLSYMFVYQAYVNNRLDVNSPKKVEAEDKIENLSDGNWHELIDNYNLDYIVVTPSEISNIHMKKENLHFVHSISNYLIFKPSK